MLQENLQINIGANTQDLQQGLNQATGAVNNFSAALNRSSRPTADATNSLVNLSRIAQDAPYGFIGIANNLNPMLESFERLQEEAGGTGEALKSMVAGLMGPAGIGVALGVVSSAIVYFRKDLEELMSSTSDYDKIQKSLRDSFYESLKSTETVINSDKALLSVITDVTQSTEARGSALKKLKEEYKGNVDLQKTDIEDGDKLLVILDKISKALIRKAEIEALTKTIGEESSKLDKLKTAGLEEQVDNVSKWVKGWELFQSAIKGGNDVLIASNYASSVSSSAIKKNDETIKSTTDSVTKLTAKLADLYKESYKAGDFKTLDTKEPKKAKENEVDNRALDLLKEQQKLYKEDIYTYAWYADQIAEEEQRLAKLKIKGKKDEAAQIIEIDNIYQAKLLSNQKELNDALAKQQEKADKEAIKEEEDYLKYIENIQTEAARDNISRIEDDLRVQEKIADKDFKQKKEAIKKAVQDISLSMEGITDPKALDMYTKALAKLFTELKLVDAEEKNNNIKKLDDQHKKFAETISKDVTNGLMTMWDAMQKGENPLKAVGDLIGKMVEQLAAAVIQAVILETILEAFGLGGAAEGGGGFFKGVGKLLGFADGGIVSSPTMAMVGEGGQSEAIMPLSKLGNMMNSTFAAGAMSGNNVGAGNGQFVLKGNDLVLALQRSNYSLNLRRGS